MADNLKKGNPDTQFKSGRKAAENGKKGGIASGKAKREKKALKETLEELLAMPIKEGRSADIDKIKSIAGIKGKNITMQEAIMVAMLNKCCCLISRSIRSRRSWIGTTSRRFRKLITPRLGSFKVYKSNATTEF